MTAKIAKPKPKPSKTYVVLTGITLDNPEHPENPDEARRWEPGSLLKDGDLPPAVITAFLTQDPPVLKPYRAKKKSNGANNDG